MTEPKRIEPLAYVARCPLCDEPLRLCGPESVTPTSCTSCSYLEPQGSAHAITYISRCVHEMVRIRGIQKAICMGNELDSSTIPYPHGLFPVISDFANERMITAGLVREPLFRNVKDAKGLLGRRTVFTSSPRPAEICIATYAQLQSIDAGISISLAMECPKGTINIDLMQSAPGNSPALHASDRFSRTLRQAAAQLQPNTGP